jgi:SAM-dependent methyltransferase
MSDVVVICRSCGGRSLRPFLSLGKTPLADALVRPEDLSLPEPVYPLDVAFCPDCTLVQILEGLPEEVLFPAGYPYFSSVSESLLQHSADHVAQLIERRGLTRDSLVVELASNDGYLLRNFVEAGIPCLGVEPTPGPAAAARAAGVPTLQEFFSADVARHLVAEGRRADVVIANNVMAHVPDLNGFVEGIAVLLADDGVVTVENPYVRDLVDHCEFDTIYHEHLCYYSCTSVAALAARHGLHLNDVEYFPDLHGGTLRWHLGKRDAPTERVAWYLSAERDAGVTEIGYYEGFAARVHEVQALLVRLLNRLRDEGSSIAAYGAAAKGSTLLNCTAVDDAVLDFVVDRNPHKQGLYMPGVRLPILEPEALISRMPDYTLILAWNFADEIARQQAEYRARGGRFIVPVPIPRVLP